MAPTPGSAYTGKSLQESLWKGETRSRSFSRLSGHYLSERSERRYLAQRPRAGRGLSADTV